MGELFLILWNRAYAAGWLVLAVLALRLPLRKAPKNARCLLWLLVGLRLALPSFPQAPVSLVPSAEVVSPAVAVIEEPTLKVHTGFPALNSQVNTFLMEHYDEGVTVAVGHTARVTAIAGWIWLAGLALLTLYGLWGWLRLKRRVREAVREDGFRRCEGIPSPFLLGLLRPAIYVPYGLEGEELDFVLAHEQAHLARRDHWTKAAAFALLAVYWFHPLLWLAYALLCRDIELACDERVIRALGEGSKAPYSRALLRCGAGRASIVCPLAFGEVGVKERVKNVLHYKKPAFWVVAASLVVCAVAAVCFLTNPAEAEDQTGQQSGGTAGAQVGGTTLPPGAQVGGGSASNAPQHYTGGALIGEEGTLNAWFPDGSGYYGDVWEEDGILTIVSSLGESESWSGSLAETASYTPEAFFALFDSDPFLSEEVRAAAAHVTTVTMRRYGGGERTETCWELSLEDGGTTLWIGDLRVYQLIEPFAAFIGGSGALWTWWQACLLPVRFSGELGTVEVTVVAGQLYRRAGEEMRSVGRSMTLEPGEIVYWDPAVGGTIPEDAALAYTFGETEEQLSVRPLMGETLSGVRTYGVTNNWLGVASSAIHETYVAADAETGGVLISTLRELGLSGPYATQAEVPVGVAEGLNPVRDWIRDAPAE